jgi:hypothetical protein
MVAASLELLTRRAARSDHDSSPRCKRLVRIATIVASAERFLGAPRADFECGLLALASSRERLDYNRAMDRRLARRNLRTGLIVAVIGLLMFALTFVAALLYNGT